MNPILTIINDGDKLFEEKFYQDFSDYWQKQSEYCEQKYLTPDTRGIIKEYIELKVHSRELALVEGLKAVVENKKSLLTMKWDSDKLQSWAYDKVLAELDEAITHLKK